jgi:hypothetical protein
LALTWLSFAAMPVYSADPPPVAEAPHVAAVPDAPTVVKAPGVPGGEITLVNRDQLRVGAGTKRVALPRQMRLEIRETIAIPESFDWTKGHTVPFPLLGNDRKGNCFYVAGCKIIIAANANATGKAVTFTTNEVVNRYLQMSPRDQGLNDNQMMPEMKSGLIGPNGPHKIVDYAVVSSTDLKALKACQYLFGPTIYTFSVPPGLVQNAKPGVLWDTQRGASNEGHAVILSEAKPNGNFSLETWGFNPPVEVTPRFIANNDPESLAIFTLEWFDAKGYAPNKLHYVTLAPVWESMTGGRLPPSPFPPPVGPTPPVPTPPIPAGTINLSMKDLNADALERLKPTGITTLNVTIGYGAPAVQDVPPSPMPSPMPSPNVPPFRAPQYCPNGVCPLNQPAAPARQRFEPFGGIFRRN